MTLTMTLLDMFCNSFTARTRSLSRHSLAASNCFSPASRQTNLHSDDNQPMAPPSESSTPRTFVVSCRVVSPDGCRCKKPAQRCQRTGKQTEDSILPLSAMPRRFVTSTAAHKSNATSRTSRSASTSANRSFTMLKTSQKIASHVTETDQLAGRHHPVSSAVCHLPTNDATCRQMSQSTGSSRSKSTKEKRIQSSKPCSTTVSRQQTCLPVATSSRQVVCSGTSTVIARRRSETESKLAAKRRFASTGDKMVSTTSNRYTSTSPSRRQYSTANGGKQINPSINVDVTKSRVRDDSTASSGRSDTTHAKHDTKNCSKSVIRYESWRHLTAAPRSYRFSKLHRRALDAVVPDCLRQLPCRWAWRSEVSVD